MVGEANEVVQERISDDELILIKGQVPLLYINIGTECKSNTTVLF